MSKILLFALFVGLSFSGYSIRKKKQLELLQSINIVYEGKGVLAGNSIDSFMQFILSDGRKLYSNSGSKLGFRDFKISVKGSGRSTWISKRRMQLQSNYNAIHDPYIHLGFEMIDNPEVALDVSIPIHFNGNFKLRYSAPSGTSGSRGKSGRSGSCGRSNYSHGNGEDGRNGARGYDAYDGRDGVDADILDVYVSMVDFHRDNTQLVKIETFYRSGKCGTRYVAKNGSMTIYNTGGCGGSGGAGGNGGDGGDINVYFTRDAEFFKSQMHFYTHGGNGGSGGNGGKGGSAGYGGTSGKGCGTRGSKGPKGSCGRSGYHGNAGQVFFKNWD
jgi:hypothetical protein